MQRGQVGPPLPVGRGLADFDINAEVAAELEALRAASLELAARRASVFVDAAGVRAVVGAEVNARAFGRGREAPLTEVSGLDLARDVLATDAPPANEIGVGHEDATILTRSTAGTARQAVELAFAHQARS